MRWVGWCAIPSVGRRSCSWMWMTSRRPMIVTATKPAIGSCVPCRRASSLPCRHEQMKAEDVAMSLVVLDTQAERLGTLLSEILSFGRWHHRNGHPPATPVGLLDAVNDALEVAPLPDLVTVAILTPQLAFPPVALADRAGLVRLLVNILTNAYR